MCMSCFEFMNLYYSVNVNSYSLAHVLWWKYLHLTKRRRFFAPPEYRHSLLIDSCENQINSLTYVGFDLLRNCLNAFSISLMSHICNIIPRIYYTRRCIRNLYILLLHVRTYRVACLWPAISGDHSYISHVCPLHIKYLSVRRIVEHVWNLLQ